MLIIIFICVFLAVVLFSFFGFYIFKKSYSAYEERYKLHAAGVLDEMFVFLPPEQILYLTFLSAFLGGFLGFIITMKVRLIIKLAVTIFLGGVGYLIPKFILKKLLTKRIEKFNNQLVDALSVVSNGLKAGFSFLQAIDTLVREMPPPISQEFGLVLQENKMGVSLDNSLLNLTKRVKSEDLDLVVTAVLTVRQVGGNLSEIFDRIAETIRERMKLQGKISALTAQGRLQGIVVGVLPLFLGIIMFKIDPEIMRPMWTEPLGWAAIGVVVILELIGAFLIKKIVTIDV